jgi:uncharacterized phosphosugar-binding protein
LGFLGTNDSDDSLNAVIATKGFALLFGKSGELFRNSVDVLVLDTRKGGGQFRSAWFAFAFAPRSTPITSLKLSQSLFEEPHRIIDNTFCA